MPLDTRKAQHILQALTRTFSGRQRTVVLVALASGNYTYSAVQVIMRPMHVVDPQVFDVAGQPAPSSADMLMIAPLTTSFTGVVYVADTTVATVSGVSPAPKYEVVEVLPSGMLPGGTHLRVSLRRLR